MTVRGGIVSARIIWCSALILGTLCYSSAQAAATFVINNLDGPGEGFNDASPPDPVSAAGGNPGNTLGAQRLWIAQQATEFWGQRVDSSVPIELDANMNPLTCNAGSAVLGSAGAEGFVRDWVLADLGPGGSLPPFAGTWYHIALANRIAATDFNGAAAEIGATFNSSVDNNNGCLNNTNWYYGLGAAPPNTIGFLETFLHEIGHGLGVSTLVNLSSGSKFGGFDDIYMKFLEDHSLGMNWPTMTNGQRQASAIDSGDLHWTGANVLGSIGVLSAGTAGGHVRNYAPNPLEGGSSVSHWDTVVFTTDNFDELMEPSATPNQKMALTDEMLQDEGWNAFEGDCAAPADDLLLQSQSVTTDQDACLTITANTNVTVPAAANVTFDAGRGITLGPEFSVAAGASFTANVNPLKTLKN